MKEETKAASHHPKLKQGIVATTSPIVTVPFEAQNTMDALESKSNSLQGLKIPRRSSEMHFPHTDASRNAAGNGHQLDGISLN